MAGKIQWQLEFLGLDIALGKLREIDRLLQRITSHQGSVFLPSSGGNIPRSPGVASVSKAASTVGAVTSAGVSIASVTSTLVSANKMFKEIEGGFKLLVEKITSDVNKQIQDAAKTQAQELAYNAIKGLPEVSGDVKGKLQRVLVEQGSAKGVPPVPNAGGYNGPIPPVISKGGILSQLSDLPKKLAEFGKAMSATGIPGISQLGGLLMKFGKLGLVVGAIIAVAYLLYQAFKYLVEGIKHGAEVYQQGAASGVGIKKSNQLREALKAIGINEEPTYQMKATSGTAGIIGAARASGFGGAQQLQNMSVEFEKAMANAASSARQMELVGKANQMLSQDMLAIGREFKTMLAEAAANLYPILHSIFQTIQDYLKIINLYFELLAKIKSLIPGGAILPTGKPGEANWPAGGGGRPSISAWEKIGFTFGRGGPTAALDNINNNTKKSSETLSSIYEYLKILGRLGGGPVLGPATQFLP